MAISPILNSLDIFTRIGFALIELLVAWLSDNLQIQVLNSFSPVKLIGGSQAVSIPL
jgi:hypothetical protein